MKLFITIWFTPSTGLENGDVLDHLDLVLRCLLINSFWSNLFPTVRFTLLSTPYHTSSKEIFKAQLQDYLELDLKILLMISGVISIWANSINQIKYLNTSWINVVNRSIIGILSIWDVQQKIWSKTIWLWLCSIMLPFGKMRNFGQKLTIAMVISMFRVKRWVRAKVTS